MELVPLCTLSDERHLHLHDEGISILHSAKFSCRKLALVGMFYVSEDVSSSPRGLFLSSNAISIVDQNASMLVLVLRHVSLVEEPFWGSLLFILSSHVVVVKAGAISTASFEVALPFLTHFAQLVVTETADADDNAKLLQELAPRLTWAALDLKLKDMNGCDSASSYFEQQLASGSTKAQLLLSTLVTTVDCLVLKSTSFQTPDEPQTSSKLVTHVADKLECKSFFGRYLNGSLVVRLVRSLTHVLATREGGTSVVLQRIATNVFTAYWQELVHQAFQTYCGFLSTRLTMYERVPITAEYLVDVTERKLQANQVPTTHHVDTEETKYSIFDEFGNLKKQQVSNADDGGSMASAPLTSLNTGLFSFLKTRAGHALSKQLSRFPSTRWSTSIRSGSQGIATKGLNGIQEDVQAAQEQVQEEEKETKTVETLLVQCTASIARFALSSEDPLDTPSEAMPVSPTVLDSIHAEALAHVNALLTPFLVDLRGPAPSSSDLTCLLDFHVGKKKLWTKMARVRRRFDRANQVASAIFCSELIRYLHSVVLKKNETDKEAHQQQPGRGRAVSSILLLDQTSGKDPVALTRVPLELLTYKNNLEAMISQYHFVARGPQAASVLLGFLHGPVRNQLQQLTQEEFNRFQQAADEKQGHINELQDLLKEKEQHVHAITAANAEWDRQEREAIAEIEQTYAEHLRSLQGAIRSTEAQIEHALAEQQVLYQRTMQATRHTIDTVDKVADKGRLVSGYLERYEKGPLFSSRWRQYFYVLKHASLTCYKSKSVFEERGPPCEPPLVITDYRVVRSRTDELKMKLFPPQPGQPMLRFRAPASVGRETWIKRFTEATQFAQ